MGLDLFFHANGIDESNVHKPYKPKSHGLGNSQILPRDYERQADIELILREMAEQVAKPLQSIDKVTIIDSTDSSNGSGVGQMGGYVPSVLAKTIESIKETTGFDITDVMKANTIQAKTDRNISVDGVDGVSNITINNDKSELSN